MVRSRLPVPPGVREKALTSETALQADDSSPSILIRKRYLPKASTREWSGLSADEEEVLLAALRCVFSTTDRPAEKTRVLLPLRSSVGESTCVTAAGHHEYRMI